MCEIEPGHTVTRDEDGKIVFANEENGLGTDIETTPPIHHHPEHEKNGYERRSNPKTLRTDPRNHQGNQ